MNALEWLRTKFAVDDEGDSFDFGAERRNGITSVFIAIFGPTIEAALAGGRNPVDDLIALPEADKRGWGPDFDVWKQRSV